jgi:hypothetical protein
LCRSCTNVIARSEATKQSPSWVRALGGDCFVASLLAMTGSQARQSHRYRSSQVIRGPILLHAATAAPGLPMYLSILPDKLSVKTAPKQAFTAADLVISLA